MTRLTIIRFITFNVAACSSITYPKEGQSLDHYLTDTDFQTPYLSLAKEKSLPYSSYGSSNRANHIVNTPDTQFMIAPVIKQFTAAALMQLQEKGLLRYQNICLITLMSLK